MPAHCVNQLFQILRSFARFRRPSQQISQQPNRSVPVQPPHRHDILRKRRRQRFPRRKNQPCLREPRAERQNFLQRIRPQNRFHVIDHQNRLAFPQRALNQLAPQLFIRSHLPREPRHQLRSNRKQHLPRFRHLLYRRKGRSFGPRRRHQPARQLRRKRRFTFPARAPHHHVTLARQHPLRFQQILPAAQKLVPRRLRQLPQRQPPPLLHHLRYLLRRRLPYELRVFLPLKQHRHEPILQPHLARKSPAPQRIRLQRQLPRQHRLPHPLPAQQLLIKRRYEALRRLHHNRVAHRRNRSHPALEQSRRYRSRRIRRRLRRLARL